MTTTNHRSKKETPPGAFRCTNCSRLVSGSAPGTANRNHCPYCLWSLHVDGESGDRTSDCRGAMEPVAVWVKRNGQWLIRGYSGTLMKQASLLPKGSVANFRLTAVQLTIGGPSS